MTSEQHSGGDARLILDPHQLSSDLISVYDSDGNILVKIFRDARIYLADGVSCDYAAREFWAAVNAAAPISMSRCINCMEVRRCDAE